MLGVNFLLVLWIVLGLKPDRVKVLEVLFVRLIGKDIYFVIFWDFFSWVFVFIVLLISTIVTLYTSYYIDGDHSRLGFIFLLSSFVVSIILLLTRPNIISLLLGWDGLGVTSYLLVVYYARARRSVAGILTFLTNRLGDIFFLLTIGVASFFFDWEILNFGVPACLIVFLLMACVTKRAQVPFSSWLPAAIAAPTPVSSLVHSSTLVTAGLYLIIRFHFLLLKIRGFIFFMGRLTLLVAGAIAVFEWDLKKLIAFSTLSQLGFIVSAFGLGLVWIRFFHLVTHALFKASLFLSAGILIHNADSSQEFRNIFGVPRHLFWVARVINVCLLCLCGIPFTRGFYSKDLIIDRGMVSWAILSLFMLGVLLTVSYSYRFFLYTFWHRNLRGLFKISYESVYFIVFPLTVLIVSALLGGWTFFECFFSFIFWSFVSPGWKTLYFFLLTCIFFFTKCLAGKKTAGYLKRFFFRSLRFLKFFFSSKGAFRIFNEREGVYKIVDQAALEKAGPQGIFTLLSRRSRVFFSSQSFLIFLFLVLFLGGFLFFWLFSLKYKAWLWRSRDFC